MLYRRSNILQVLDRALSRMIPHLCLCTVFAFFSRVINLLLTMLARDRTGRMSALGLFLYGPRCARSVLSRPQADILPVLPTRLVSKTYMYRFFPKTHTRFQTQCPSARSRPCTWVLNNTWVLCNTKRNLNVA